MPCNEENLKTDAVAVAARKAYLQKLYKDEGKARAESLSTKQAKSVRRRKYNFAIAASKKK
jgi:hypothetical protein